jgi:ABC-type branched-subunit amino acid transport system ATPase component
MSAGRVLVRGHRDAVLNNPEVVRTFIGEPATAASAPETA